MSKKLEDKLGHDYESCDHCANCGAEQFESEAYYQLCSRSFITEEIVDKIGE